MSDGRATVTLESHYLVHPGRVLVAAIGADRRDTRRGLVTTDIDGHGSTTSPCPAWSLRDQSQDDRTVDGQNGKSITLTLRIQALSSYVAAAYAKHPASRTIAVYD